MEPIISWLAPIVSALVVCAGQWLLNRRFKQADKKRDDARNEAESARVEREKWERAINAGVRSLLRCELIRSHKEFVIMREPMTMDDLEYIQRTYESYHDLGGNGSATKLYTDLMSVSVKAGD